MAAIINYTTYCRKMIESNNNEYLKIYLAKISDQQVAMLNLLESKMDSLNSKMDVVSRDLSKLKISEENQRLRIESLDRDSGRRCKAVNGMLTVAIGAFLTALFSATFTIHKTTDRTVPISRIAPCCTSDVYKRWGISKDV